jgi:hypothetical protein
MAQKEVIFKNFLHGMPQKPFDPSPPLTATQFIAAQFIAGTIHRAHFIKLNSPRKNKNSAS